PGGVGLNANTAVTFTLRRASDNLYWSGSVWQGTAVNLATTSAATADGISTTWSGNVTLPTWSSEDPGSYTVQAKATDKLGNTFTGPATTFFLLKPYSPSNIGGANSEDSTVSTLT